MEAIPPGCGKGGLLMTDSRHVRVLTWNLWGRHADWQSRASSIVAVLRNSGADVIALQEVWADEASGDEQAVMLADALGFYSHSTMVTTSKGCGLGNAILSRWPIAESGYDLLPTDSPDDIDRRVAVFAMVSSPWGVIPTISTHLSWQRNLSAVRQKQTRKLAALATTLAAGQWPAILMGDFNADPDSDEIRQLTGRRAIDPEIMVFQDAWEHGGDNSGGYTWTYHNLHFEASRAMRLDAMPWLRRRLDYIFVGLPDGIDHPIEPIQVVHALLRGFGEDGIEEGSDHYALLAELCPLRKL